MPSATLATLVADTESITKRPDLPTALHVKNALLKAHSSDYFLQDIFETNISFPTAASVYSLDIKSLIPRFRTMKYLNVIDPITEEYCRKLTGIPIEKFLDSYEYLRTDVFYVAGSNVQIRLAGNSYGNPAVLGDRFFGLGCYLYPDTSLLSPSWIADQFPFAILYEAARTLFKTIGYDEQSTSMERLVAEAISEVRMTGITTVGE